jgi:hypothetical protein
MQFVEVHDRQFSWEVFVSDDYPLLAKPYPSPVTCELVRIAAKDGFDIVLRVDRQTVGGVAMIVFGPIQVIGAGFPTSEHPIESGVRIRLRPKVAAAEATEITSAQIERIVAWCVSDNFKAVPCDRHGLPVQSKERLAVRPV